MMRCGECTVLNCRCLRSPPKPKPKIVKPLKTTTVRKYERYRQWRTEVWGRDGGRCVLCGSDGDHVDHIRTLHSLLLEFSPRSKKEALACAPLWDTDNGRVLCKPCHAKQPTTPVGLALRWK